MKKQEDFSLQKRLKSFKYAFEGILMFFKQEHNARIQFFAAICVILAGFYFQLNQVEWIAIVFCVGLVLVAEIMNTAIENIADFVCVEQNSKIKIIKDLAAGGVLISTTTVAVIGIIIFLPKIITME